MLLFKPCKGTICFFSQWEIKLRRTIISFPQTCSTSEDLGRNNAMQLHNKEKQWPLSPRCNKDIQYREKDSVQEIKEMSQNANSLRL